MSVTADNSNEYNNMDESPTYESNLMNQHMIQQQMHQGNYGPQIVPPQQQFHQEYFQSYPQSLPARNFSDEEREMAKKNEDDEEEEILGSDNDEQEDRKDYCIGLISIFFNDHTIL